MSGEVRLKRPAECVRDCSDGDHEFAPDGSGEIITTLNSYDLYHCSDHEDDPSDPNAEVVEASWVKEYHDDGDVKFLCRCCQHALDEVD